MATKIGSRLLFCLSHTSSSSNPYHLVYYALPISLIDLTHTSCPAPLPYAPSSRFVCDLCACNMLEHYVLYNTIALTASISIAIAMPILPYPMTRRGMPDCIPPAYQMHPRAFRACPGLSNHTPYPFTADLAQTPLDSLPVVAFKFKKGREDQPRPLFARYSHFSATPGAFTDGASIAIPVCGSISASRQ